MAFALLSYQLPVKRVVTKRLLSQLKLALWMIFSVCVVSDQSIDTHWLVRHRSSIPNPRDVQYSYVSIQVQNNVPEILNWNRNRSWVGNKAAICRDLICFFCVLLSRVDSIAQSVGRADSVPIGIERQRLFSAERWEGKTSHTEISDGTCPLLKKATASRKHTSMHSKFCNISRTMKSRRKFAERESRQMLAPSRCTVEMHVLYRRLLHCNGIGFFPLEYNFYWQNAKSTIYRHRHIHPVVVSVD